VVEATLSQPLSGSSAAALQVFSAQRGGRLAGSSGTTMVGGSTISFTPARSFRPGETVQATLTTAAQTTSGQALATARV
jgi:hypothetical protein